MAKNRTDLSQVKEIENLLTLNKRDPAKEAS